MEVGPLTKKWLAVAKAEFKVETSSYSGKRIPVVGLAFSFGILWAFIFAPMAMDFILTRIIGVPRQIIVVLLPGVFRAGMMLIWFILVLLPLANALKEIKIGQWEVLLSNNVSSRDIFVGSFLGKLPTNGLLVLYLAPILVSPFVEALGITVTGQALMYCLVALTALNAIWLSDTIVTYTRARLGESERQKDIAGALALIVGMVSILPLLGFQLFASQMMEMLGLDIFLLFPFTWGADLMSSVATLFMRVGSGSSPVPVVIGFDAITNIVLMTGYTIILVGGTLGLVNRVLTFNLDSNYPSDRITSDNNIRERRGRILLSTGFGLILITVLKDFTRKAQNITRLGQMIGMAVFLPIVIGFVVSSNESSVDFMMVLVMISLAFAILSGQAFGAAGFLESRDQLWMIQSAPKGTSTYIVARLVQATLLLIPCAIIPATVVSLFVQFTVMEVFLLFTIPLCMGIGSALVAIGVTASRPTYEDTNSAGFKSNIAKFMAITLLSFMSYMILDLLLGLAFGLGDITQMIYENGLLYMGAMFGPLPLVGIFVFVIGKRRFGHIE